MITLIADILINEYTQDAYTLQVSTFRQTGELLSIVLIYDFFEYKKVEMFYGKPAKDLHFALTRAKLSKKLGYNDKLDLSQFHDKGLPIKLCKESLMYNERIEC